MRYIGRHKKDSGKYPSLLLSVGKLSESRRLNLNRLISAPSTLALKWLVFRRDYCCEQNSPHYEPHTNSSCYEEATFAEANSDKQGYATNLSPERETSPRLPSQSFATSDSATDMFKEVFNASSIPAGMIRQTDQLMRAWASIRRGRHSQQTIPTKYDCSKQAQW